MPETKTKTSQRWAERLRRFEHAEMTVAQFCVSEGVSQPSFYHWRKKLRELDLIVQSSPTASFLPVSLPQTTRSVQVTLTTVELPGGIRIRVETPVDPTTKVSPEDLP